MMFCSSCGKENPNTAKFCAGCGKPIAEAAAPAAAPAQQTIINMAPPPQAAPAAPVAAGVSPKSKTAAALLAFFLGQLGIHRFYAGKVGTAIVMLLLTIIGYATIIIGVGIFVLIAVGIWILVDFIMILMGKFKDKNGLLISK
jgi:TM2 domain-containing membrane protein YozV